MIHPHSSHRAAIWQALLVTLLWSTSWVLIKFGLTSIPALSFAGLRYSLAFLCLLPFALRPTYRAAWRKLSVRDWLRFTLLGILFYAVTQGAQFLGLLYLPAVTTSLMLNITSLLVAFLGIWLLNESLTVLQWLGMAAFLIGVIVYFYPVSFAANQWLGLLIVSGGMLANAFSSILGRSINRGKNIPALVVTTASMGIGSLLLLMIGGIIQGIPSLDLKNWLVIVWLAVVNTAFAFTLWNHTLQTLSAVESSIINSTMMVQIALLAWAFLGETLSLQTTSGLILAAAGVLLVQIRRISLLGVGQ